MNINKVVIRNFKRFGNETFNLGGDHVVIAGPNNSGKTTLLQAIATWSLALERWRELNNYQRRGGVYAKAPISRQVFYPVPVRAFDLLWHERASSSSIVIEITTHDQTVPIEIKADSTEQVYVRPHKDVPPIWLQNTTNILKPIFVPAMTGLSTEEPVYQKPKINQLLGQGKPGDVLRNLLAKSNQSQVAWERLTDSISSLFGYQLLPPSTDGPNIIAEYQHANSGARLDIASAGSGFLQVLMLLTFLHSRRGMVLLLDEPDAHLHVILQDGIYRELRRAAQDSNSQLVIATHSGVVINSVDSREICALLGTPRKLVDDNQKKALIDSLSLLSNMDIMLALEKKCVLYVENYTDVHILQEWARVLNHPIQGFINKPFWKPVVSETRRKGKGIKARDHFKALLIAHENMCGVQIYDRDGHVNIPNNTTTFEGKLLKLCWMRYEIENYLMHPAVLARYIGKTVDQSAPLANLEAMQNEMRGYLSDKIVDNPLDYDIMHINTKMRRFILPSILENAGLPDLSYTRYHEIAAVMEPNEIHPDIVTKLDAMAEHFQSDNRGVSSQ